MRIKHRFACDNDHTDVVKYLEHQKIKYTNEHEIIVFEIFEDEEYFSRVENLMQSKNHTHISTAVYTREEINEAQWLTIWSVWQSQYPYPRENYEYLKKVYDLTNYCDARYYNEESEFIQYCGNGLIQKDAFTLLKEVKWGARNFTMLNWINDEFFISPKAEEILNNSGLTGFNYYNVYKKDGTVMNNIKQLSITHYLPEGFVGDVFEEKHTCPKCNCTRYVPKTGANNFKKEIFANLSVDIIKTTDKFGGISCASMVLISNNFYKVITDAKLDKNLVFEPVVLV